MVTHLLFFCSSTKQRLKFILNNTNRSLVLYYTAIYRRNMDIDAIVFLQIRDYIVLLKWNLRRSPIHSKLMFCKTKLVSHVYNSHLMSYIYYKVGTAEDGLQILKVLPIQQCLSGSEINKRYILIIKNKFSTLYVW